MWYKEGLRFKCTGCGMCCTGSPGYVWISQEEAALIAQSLNLSIEKFINKFVRFVDGQMSLIEKSNYDCIFLKDKKCQIYSVRPKQCRSFPWWKRNLESESAWKEAALHCEGISDQAPQISYDEIEKFKS